MIPIQDIGVELKCACHLAPRPLFIIALEEIPTGSVEITSIDRCVAKAMFKMASTPTIPPAYLSADQAGKGWPGGMQWTGFCEANPMIKYFVSTGHKDFRNGMAEFLRATPEIADEAASKAGKFMVQGNHLGFFPCTTPLPNTGRVLALTCFGTAEQVRNLATLAQFRSTKIFHKILMAEGPACSTLVSFPSGLAENAPREAAYIGPADPTGNAWFPPDFMAIG